MRITQNSLLNLVEQSDYLNHMINHINNLKKRDFDMVEVHEERIMLLKKTDYRKLVLSEKTEKNLSNYIVPKEIRYEVLRSLPNRMDSILIDKDCLLRYIKTDNLILVTLDYYVENKYIDNHYFRIDLINEQIFLTIDGNNVVKGHNDFINNFINRFMVVVTYLELTPVTFEVIEGGRSLGTRKSGKIKNETNKKFILVTTNWNVEKINLNSFGVRGHFRLQGCGVGRGEFRYVYVKPYEKGLVHRLSQRELVG